jgi:excisionase family DNA binding protein
MTVKLCSAQNQTSHVDLRKDSAAMSETRTDSRVVMTVAEAAALLGLSKNSAYKAVHTGEIPTIKIGGKYVVPIAAFQRLLQQLKTSPGTPEVS